VPSGVRTLLVLVIAGGGFLLALVVLDRIGLGRLPFVQIPAAIFAATIVIWPLMRGTLALDGTRPFVDWVAYNAALMLLFGLVMYAVNTWVSAHGAIQQFSR
jgi:hypothetical protein